MNLELVLWIVGGALVGGVAALKVIAPRTTNTKDDALLARLEQLEKLVTGLLPKK